MAKRCFDIVFSLCWLVFLSPLLLLLATLIVLIDGKPILFRQVRVGRNRLPFVLYKYRTMYVDSGPLWDCTAANDLRVTWLGALLRKYKLDELPQLFNVLKGDMSIVGPRPELHKFVALFEDEFGLILKVRPGITDVSSIIYRNESQYFDRLNNGVEQYYIENILPRKIVISKAYVYKHSFYVDLIIIIQTVLGICGDTYAKKSKPVVACYEVKTS